MDFNVHYDIVKISIYLFLSLFTVKETRESKDVIIVSF